MTIFNLELLLTILAGVCLVVGIIGSFVPMLPGPPIAWVGLLLAFFSDYNNIPLLCLIITCVVMIVVTVFDIIMPSKMTKKTGGSKAATWGCTIGIILGLFIPPFGILIFPFVGALVGELINTNADFKVSLKSAFGAFLGFLLGTGIKLFTVIVYIVIYIISFRK